MKALTLHQPWASLVADGVKTIETRSWSTNYRGPLAIHAGKRKPPVWWRHVRHNDFKTRSGNNNWHDSLERYCHFDELDGWEAWSWGGPLGAIVATCELVDVVPIVEDIPPQDEWHEPWSVVTSAVVELEGGAGIVIRAVTMYRAECDCCDCGDDCTEHYAWADEEQAKDEALASEWIEVNGSLICPGCQQWDDEADEMGRHHPCAASGEPSGRE